MAQINIQTDAVHNLSKNIHTTVEAMQPMLTQLNEIPENIITSWVTDMPTAREEFTNKMLASIRGLTQNIIPGLDNFATSIDEYATAIEEINSNSN